MASFSLQRLTCRLQVVRASRCFAFSYTNSPSRYASSYESSQYTPSHPSTDRLTFKAGDVKVSFSLKHPRNSPRYRRQFSTHTTKAASDYGGASQPATSAPSSTRPSESTLQTTNFNQGLNDGSLADTAVMEKTVDWTRSFQGLSNEAFSPEAAKVLLAPLDLEDIEIKPDGILYLPEIKYRRILNKAFGPGGWGLAPRGETIITAKSVTREYALVALGRLVSIARGEQDYFNPEGIPTAVEGCKSTALRRCCKDLGIASELWDPRFIRKFIADNVKELFVEHVVTKKKRKIYLRKGEKAQYPYKETR